MEHITLNWSSGKDAAMAFLQLHQSKQYEVKSLLTTVSTPVNRVSMHGIRTEILELQAERMNLPLKQIFLDQDADMTSYNKAMHTALNILKREGIHSLAFGDLFLEDLKTYREKQLAEIGMNAIFPLWKRNTHDLASQLEENGIKAIIVCVNEKYLGKEFLGRMINKELLAELPENVDPCGENGEYHTLVIDAPYFSQKIDIEKGEIVHKIYTADNNASWDSSYYFMDILLK